MHARGLERSRPPELSVPDHRVSCSACFALRAALPNSPLKVRINGAGDMTTETEGGCGLLCDGACADFRYWDVEWSIWICSLCDRPRAVGIGVQ